MKKLFLILPFILGCDSVDRNHPKVVSINENTLLGDGEYVGKLKNGNVVKRYEIDMGPRHNHFIYIIDDNPTVTVNRNVSDGDTSRNEVTVIIDGTKYLPAEKIIR